MNNKLLALTFILSACAPKREVVQIINGKDGIDGTAGADGQNGQDGYSLVYQRSEASECQAGGVRYDLFLDLDRSLSLSEGDGLSESFEVCNGVAGLNGADGQNGMDGQDGQDGTDGVDGVDGQDGADGAAGSPGSQGPAGSPGTTVSIVSYTSSSCSSLGGGLYTKPNGSNTGVYSSSSCHSSSKIYELDEGESVWLNANTLAVKLSPSGLRTITFN